jgi:hypothetical protein
MILGIRRRLIQEIHRLPTQFHPFTLEPNIANPRLILLALTPVIFEEQIQTPHGVEESALDRDLLHIVRLRQVELLGWRKFGRSSEVEVFGVDEQLQCLRR